MRREDLTAGSDCVKGLGRHSDICTTMRHYITIEETAMMQAVEKLPSLLPADLDATEGNHGPDYGPTRGRQEIQPVTLSCKPQNKLP